MAVRLPKGFCKVCGSRLAGKGRYCDSHRPKPKYKERKSAAYDSQKEMQRGNVLANLLRLGAIRNLQEQVEFSLVVNGRKVGTYTADFVYDEYNGVEWIRVVEDVKGFRSSYYKMKARLFHAVYGFRIRET